MHSYIQRGRHFIFGLPLLLLTVGLGIALVSAHRHGQVTKWDPTQANGFYWIRDLYESESPPAFDSPGRDDEARGFCLISTDAASGASTFMIPHPCAPIIRSIRLESTGFHAVAPSAVDTGKFELTGTVAKNGVLVVAWNDGNSSTRLALQKATPEQMESAWGGTDQSHRAAVGR